MVVDESKLVRDFENLVAEEGRQRGKKLARSKEWQQIEAEWTRRAEHVCKPCWELKYCPYGPLVEQFPLPGIEREAAVEHNEFLKEQLAKGAYVGARKRYFQHEVKTFNANDYPKEIPRQVKERACKIFGHICPVFFVNEPFTETLEMRRITRTIPRHVMLRVVRRDDYTCQKCHRHLNEDELEFHHKIPFAKGGPTDETNIQLYCYDCNHSQGSKVPEEISSGLFEGEPETDTNQP